MIARVRKISLFAALTGLILAAPVHGQHNNSARLKDLVRIEGALPLQLTGFGLIVGLDGTGDRVRGRRGSPHTVQSIANMLQHFGITVDPALVTARNAAAVMVTATVDPFSSPGSRIDVTLSSLGDARSLSGGILLQTPLLDANTGEVYATAQGPVSTGSVLASSLGSSVQVNHTNTGRIPGGGFVVKTPPFDLNARTSLGLVLKRPDFTNAARIAEVINTRFPGVAEVSHAGLIRVNADEHPGGVSGFMADLEAMEIEVDLPARVVINERTGTVVAGGNVRISEVMVTYGSLIVTTQADPFVSQPPPFSNGETVAGAAGTAGIEEEGTRSVVLPPNTDVNQLAAALNDLGLTARDVIAIFQAIDRSGALQGELVIL
jgi:flagellar P-ring protein precursor FlgI